MTKPGGWQLCMLLALFSACTTVPSQRLGARPFQPPRRSTASPPPLVIAQVPILPAGPARRRPPRTADACVPQYDGGWLRGCEACADPLEDEDAGCDQALECDYDTDVCFAITSCSCQLGRWRCGSDNNCG